MKDGMCNNHKSDRNVYRTYVNDVYGNAKLCSGCCAKFTFTSLTASLLQYLLLQGIALHRQSVSSQQNNLNIIQITLLSLRSVYSSKLQQ